MVDKALALDAMAKLDLESPAEVNRVKTVYNDKDAPGHAQLKQILKKMCPYFVDSEAYATGNKTVNSYKVCCEVVDYCSFYVQTWFYIACGGVGLLLIIIILIVVFCCCCKKRGGGGKDAESIETSDATEKEDY
ncbi:hypothetical protein CRE_14584 [Caenorhabditis remanei]|uniref:Uncharacterized protein n=1 Tax=Caenorhabditis remanei TaxID=31234 RepID=E3M9P0_CAERE|nr:hypothetical protein CRE_14584 [Caenorhabditis remanei]